MQNKASVQYRFTTNFRKLRVTFQLVMSRKILQMRRDNLTVSIAAKSFSFRHPEERNSRSPRSFRICKQTPRVQLGLSPVIK